jgi:hypothetical protein
MIYILDQITLKPGSVEAFMDCFEADYLPAAVQRNMSLSLRSVSPPVELEGQSSDVILLWKINQIGEFWSMRKEAKVDASVASFWQTAEAWVETRNRKVLSPYPTDSQE